MLALVRQTELCLAAVSRLAEPLVKTKVLLTGEQNHLG